MIRIFILAASPVARAGLEAVLRRQTAVRVVGSAADFEALSEFLTDAEPDVLVADVSGVGERAALEEFSASDVSQDFATVVLTDAPSSRAAVAALRAGVRAVLPRTVPPEQLLAAIEAAAAGLVVVQPAELASLMTDAARLESPGDLADALTRREREVLQMLGGGLGNKEIAAKLSISEHTAKFHVASILSKLGASTRTEAVSIGIRHGLILL